MMLLRVTVAVVLLLALLVAGYLVYAIKINNPRVERELITNPQGERARKVMLLTLPTGRRIPVNYYRDGDMVFAGADGPWWKELASDGAAVSVWVQGETHAGTARVIQDDPGYTERIFSKLRPTAIKGFGRLVEITLSEPRP